MKKLFVVLAVVLSLNAFAQAPEKLSYQAVVRDVSNSLVVNQAIGIQISIIDGSASGVSVYTETQNPTTNANGLISLEIGTGTVVSGTFNTIDWSTGVYYVKTETDPNGGANYSITGTSQFMSVPYSLHAKTAESVINDAVDDADADATNEIQNLEQVLTEGNNANGQRIVNTGRIGVGTANPSYITDIQGTGGPRLRVFSKDGYFAGVLAKNNTHEYFMGAQGTYEAANRTNSGFHIYDNTVGAQRMVIDATGNMGVGNYAPTEKLDVNGNIKLSGTVDGRDVAADGTVLDNHVADTANPHNVTKSQVGLTNVENVKVNLGATTAPTSNDDASAGYTVGSRWLDIVGGKEYVCVGNSVGAAVWITTAGDDAVNDADSDPTNEIEIPTGGTDGQVLKTDGSGNYNWVDQTEDTDTVNTYTAGNGIAINNNVVSNTAPNMQPYVAINYIIALQGVFPSRSRGTAAASIDPLLGEVVMFAGNFAPRGWALCDGQLLAISQYSALFSILGTTYGGDGRTTFALPDLRGRAPIHAGNGSGLTNRRLGAKGGNE